MSISPIHERMKRIAKMREELSVLERSLIYDLGLECGNVNDSPPSIRIVQETTAAILGANINCMRSPVRTATFVEARQVAMYLCRKLTSYPLSAIGAAFNRDHGTVLNAHEKVTNRMSIEPNFTAKVEAIESAAHRKISERTLKSAEAS